MPQTRRGWPDHSRSKNGVASLAYGPAMTGMGERETLRVVMPGFMPGHPRLALSPARRQTSGPITRRSRFAALYQIHQYSKPLVVTAARPASHIQRSRDGAVEPAMMLTTSAARPCPRALFRGLSKLTRLRAPLRMAKWDRPSSFQVVARMNGR